METKMEAYIKSLTGGLSVREVSKRAGIHYSKVNRQLNENRLDADLAIKITRTFGGNVLEALVVADYITKEEAGRAPHTEALQAATEQELAQEILRRVQAGSDTLTKPLGE